MAEQEEQYKLTGMVCASCAQAVEKAIAKLPGVTEVNVNLAVERMKVKVDGNSLSPEQIIKAVEKAGYGAELAQDLTRESNEKEQAEKKESLKVKRNRMVGALALSVILMFVAMTKSFLGANVSQEIIKAFIELVLTIPILWFGRDFLIVGSKALKNLAPNMDSLVLLGSGISFLYSLVNTIIMVVTQNSQPLYYEASGMILALIMLGKYLEAVSKQKTTTAMTSLLTLIPKTAIKLDDQDQPHEVQVDSIKVGDRILVKSGQTIPVDGQILEGSTTVDNSMLTGESLPISKFVGDEVVGGSLNQNGQIVYRATRVGEDTALAQIIKLVADAQGSKAPIARLADKIAGVFVPVIMVIALLGFIGWMLAGSTFAFAVNIFVAVVVIACPCALGLATPTAIMVATGKGAKFGVLFKDGAALESLTKIDTIVFDKTGTITQGTPVVTDVIVKDGFTKETVLQYAASLEFYTEHPLAKAILDANEKESLKVSDFETLPGLGIKGQLADKQIYVGNNRLIEQTKLTRDHKLAQAVAKMRSQGQTLVYVAAEQDVIGVIAISDPIKADSAYVIEQLNHKGVKTVLLTGDNKETAQKIGQEAGITEIISDVLPDGKAAVIKQLQERGDKVAMVGDGINDAPALTQADIGIAIGTGTDVAVESAQVILMDPELSALLTAYELSYKTMFNIKENLFWAFFYNILGVPIALGVLTLFGGPFLNPMIAAGAMGFSSVTVVLNALRLNRFKPKMFSK
ncbi:heavy metal translocating P-type ATPase, partial [Ligilactobacillus ceti]|uniref:P-type Cu(+) transporter n=1 Tax=Ligilactobacillus ceti DSM 22408 TaxID=1122146 RepID=A0A0R2KPT2_9LACO